MGTIQQAKSVVVVVAALGVFLVLGVGEVAHADGLKAGEVVFTATNPAGGRSIVRMNQFSGVHETIPNPEGIAASTVAIGGAGTIYAVEADDTNHSYRVWKVDVHTGLTELIKELFWDDYQWAAYGLGGYLVGRPDSGAIEVESTGKLLVLVNGADGVGHILRLDPTQGDGQEPQEVVVSGYLQSGGGGDMKVTATGEVYVSLGSGLPPRRVEFDPSGNSLVPIWTTVDPASHGGFSGFAPTLDHDPVTGNLVVRCDFYELCSGDPSDSELLALPSTPAAITYDFRDAAAIGTNGAVFVESDPLFVSAGFSGIEDIEVVRSQCSDGFSNDADGLVDFGSDPQCNSLQDNSEAPLQSCQSSISPISGVDTSVVLLISMAALWFERRRYLA